MPNFVQLLLEHTKNYESPTSFWKWSAYSTISAILRDNCFRKLGDIFIFPNIYVLLLADSAIHRKGNPVKLCQELVQSVANTKLIAGRSSIQAILVELAGGETNPTTGKILKGGSALFSASELSASIVADPQAVQILTDIYDFHENYVSRLKGSGTFTVKNVCFSMIAASNEELLRAVYDQGAIFGGLLGRTFLVKPDEFRPGNSLFNIQTDARNHAAMKSELLDIAQLKGMIDYDEEAQREYDNWYLPFREGYKGRSDRSGVSGRIHTSVVKLASILAINDTKELCVRKRHIEESINECMSLIPNYQSFVMSSGKSTIAEVASILLGQMNENGGTASRRDVMARNWQNFDLKLFDECINSLEAGGMITSGPGINGNDIVYVMTGKCKELLFKKEEKK